jgi:glycogen debranching enzyme
MVRYGFVKEAHRVIDAMLDVASHYDGRLPELLAGLDRAELPVPAVYPTSCIPQAWAAASPLLFVRSLLRLDPAIPQGRVWLGPEMPEWLDHIEVDGIPLGRDRITISASREGSELRGLDERITVHAEPRFPCG